jgi:hypothetical protein
MDAIKKNTGMAVTSLVLGILSCVCFGLLAGIPAIILGHIAYCHARKHPDQYGGAGLAIAGFVTGYASVFMTFILAAMLLPALAAAKAKAQRVNCVNQMMQIGVAARLWEGDHSDRYPFNVPATEGGTQEFCQRDAEGFDANSWRHFQVMSNELNTPKILVCPADHSRQPALNFSDFGPANVTYQVCSGTNVADIYPEQVLARCPIHHIVLKCDCSVTALPKKR